MHQREITFRNNPLVLFGGALDAIRRIARLALGNRNEVADFIGTRRTRPKHPRLKLDELTDIEFVIHEPNLPCRSNWQRRRRRPCGRAGNGRSALSGWPSEQVAHGPCGIEQLALQLRRDRVPLHDNGGAEAPKNMLLDIRDRPTFNTRSSGHSLRSYILRTDDLVEIIRKPVFVLRELNEALRRSLKLANFVWHIGMFE